jgi:hypothetical protein
MGRGLKSEIRRKARSSKSEWGQRLYACEYHGTTFAINGQPCQQIYVVILSNGQACLQAPGARLHISRATPPGIGPKLQKSCGPGSSLIPQHIRSGDHRMDESRRWRLLVFWFATQAVGLGWYEAGLWPFGGWRTEVSKPPGGRKKTADTTRMWAPSIEPPVEILPHFLSSLAGVTLVCGCVTHR